MLEGMKNLLRVLPLMFPLALFSQGTRNDTTYFYWFDSHQVSVKITPWQNQHRNIYVFDRNGDRTWIFSDYQNQDTCITTLEFNENGSVKMAETRYRNHPDSWYSIVRNEFTVENNITRRFTRYFPEGSGHFNHAEYWDPDQNMWVPEVMELIGPPNPMEGSKPDKPCPKYDVVYDTLDGLMHQEEYALPPLDSAKKRKKK